MEPELPDGWEETDRNDYFASEIGLAGPVTPAQAVYENQKGYVIVVHDELDKPIEHQEDPRFTMDVLTPEDHDLLHGHAESSHERAEAAVTALAYMVNHRD